MTKKIKGDLILTKDTEFDESIEVKGNINGYFNLKVAGNIDAWDIDALNIDASVFIQSGKMIEEILFDKLDLKIEAKINDLKR